MKFPFVLLRTYKTLQEEHAALAAQVRESVGDNRALREHLSSIITEGAEHTKYLYARIAELEQEVLLRYVRFD